MESTRLRNDRNYCIAASPTNEKLKPAGKTTFADSIQAEKFIKFYDQVDQSVTKVGKHHTKRDKKYQSTVDMNINEDSDSRKNHFVPISVFENFEIEKQSSLLEKNMLDMFVEIESMVQPPAPLFSETVAIDTTDLVPKIKVPAVKKHVKTSELSVHRSALPMGVKKEAKILVPKPKTSRLDLSRSIYSEAIPSQREGVQAGIERGCPEIHRRFAVAENHGWGTSRIFHKDYGQPDADVGKRQMASERKGCGPGQS